MESVVDNAAEATSPNKQPGPRFRLHFLAAFLISYSGLVLAILIAHMISEFVYPGDPLFGGGAWIVFFGIIATYGIVFAAILGSLFRLLSFYRLTESEFIQASLFGKQLRIPWAEISSVEPVRAFRFLHIPVYRLLHERSDRPLYFINCLSKRKIFDARITEYTQESHPFHLLLRKPKRKHK